MTTENTRSKEWTYRNLNCQVFVLTRKVTVGYVVVGDEAVEVIDGDYSLDDAQSRVEDEVDEILQAVLNYDTSTIDLDPVPPGGDPFIGPETDPIIDPDSEPIIDPDIIW
jgi:hypothetical protein